MSLQQCLRLLRLPCADKAQLPDPASAKRWLEIREVQGEEPAFHIDAFSAGQISRRRRLLVVEVAC
ncbi:hypothetical protein CCR84_03645 [Rhodocyclus purpureus]|nr:hypothetical protein [Rhodocyclus purpureus]